MRARFLPAVLALLFVLTSCAGWIGTDARDQFEQGLSYFNQGKYAEAIPYFTKATELEPEFAQAYLYLGRSHLNLNQWVEAVPPLRTAYRLAPLETKKEAVNILLDALLGAALSQVKQGNFQASFDYLREGLNLAPESDKSKTELGSTVIQYGSSLLSQGQVAPAIKAFQEAIGLAPNNIDGYLGLARAFFNNGDFAKAINTLRQAIQVDPGNNAAQSLLMQLLKTR